MKNFFLAILLVCFSIVKAQTTSEINAIENGLLPALRIKGESITKYNIQQRMEYYNVPGASIAIVRDGKLWFAKGYGVANTDTGERVDVNTLFQAASISKPISALGILKLVENGIVDLNSDVNTYLSDWKVPENLYTEDEKVSLKKLMTHTGSVTVHGFPGYKQTDTFPTTKQVLNGEGNTQKVELFIKPGTMWKYSGGGYTVLQKVVEDVTGLPFNEYIDINILEPLRMSRSTFQQPIDTSKFKNISAAYDGQGKIVEGWWHNYPEKAAAGLWTTPSDLAKYCMEIQQIAAGKKDGLLKRETVDQILTKHQGDWGLGPRLQGEEDSLIFRHNGKNKGFTNDMQAFAHTGNAIILMTNADNGGKLNAEIIRGVSDLLNWNLMSQQEIEVGEMPTEYLKAFTGKYKLNYQVPDIGDYIVEMSVENDYVKIYDPNNGEVNILKPLSETKFADINSGSEFEFSDKNEPLMMIINGSYKFLKIED